MPTTIKNSRGEYVTIPDKEEAPLSVDELLLEGQINIQRIMNKISVETSRASIPDRNVVQSLKDCITMLKDLKVFEDRELKEASEEDLKKMLKK